MLYVHFESNVKPVDEEYREKINQMNTERKVKAPHTEKTNAHALSGWCVYT